MLLPRVDLLYVDLLSALCKICVENKILRLEMSLIHTFAKNLKKYRAELNMSQEYLAELAGLHRTYISAVEREKRNISIENIQRISDALKIEPYRLFMDESE